MRGITEENMWKIINTHSGKDGFVPGSMLINKLEELNPWQPIDSAPKGRPGFQATTTDFDRIEWLVDYGVEDRFFNRNSGNYTDKSCWSHWKELPEEPL